MGYTFERPIGAAGDAKELEYIAALHQTQHGSEDDWRDASIEATDVKNFLLSRYGIEATKKEVLDLIFAEMGGGDDSDECIDLCEVVAILLIPFLAKIGTNTMENGNLSFIGEIPDAQLDSFYQSQFEVDAYLKSQDLRASILQDKKIISDILGIIIKNATGSFTKSQRLTPELLRQIFSYYGEGSLIADDDLVDEMIRAVASYEGEGGSTSPMLNEDTFLHALTHDTKLYDVANESRFQTHYEDVFGLVTYAKREEVPVNGSGYKETHNAGEDEDTFEPEPDSEAGKYDVNGVKIGQRNVKRIFTFGHIDSLDVGVRSKGQYFFVWVTVIACYLAWFPFDGFGKNICGGESEEAKSFGCQVAQSIVLWIFVFLSMVLVIAPGVCILSLGNNIYRHSIVEIICAIGGIIVLVIVPTLYHFDIGFINTKINDKDDIGSKMLDRLFDTITLTSGCILLYFQACNIIRFIVPDSRLTKSKALTMILRGSSVRSEFSTKQATVLKVHKMVQNAYSLHQSKKIIQDEDSMKLSFKAIDNNEPSNEDALLNFTKASEEKELSGGFKWAWKMVLSGKLAEEEGVWLHTKLLAGVCAQALVTCFVCIFIAIVSSLYLNAIYSSVEVAESQQSSASDSQRRMAEDCSAVFTPADCFFFDSNGTSAGFGICSGVFLSDSTCKDQFVNVTGPAYDLYCDIFKEGVEQLPPPASLIYSECPEVYWPENSNFLAVTSDSTEESYCTSTLNACSAPIDTYYGTYFDVCVIGFGSAYGYLPFDFTGDLCYNYTEMETLLRTRDEIQEGDYFPRAWQLYLSTWVGIFCVLLAGFTVTISTVPSMVITTLRFRSGAIESLHDRYFLKYREGVLATTFLLGGFFWGAGISALVVFVVVFLITFVSVYQVTSPYVLGFLSLLVGISVTLVIKILASFFLNRYTYVGFYRKHPLVANIASLCFECWHLALTSGYIVFRCVKLLIIIIVYLGRFDTPVLGHGVGEIGPIKLDAFPFIFKQDLLAIDAHRHPYIERLGMMYMMKLKHGDNFARKAGSIWRLLFVFALFPWLRKYRILNDNDAIDSDSATEMLDDSSSVMRSSMLQTKISALNDKIKRLTEMNKYLAKNK